MSSMDEVFTALANEPRPYGCLDDRVVSAFKHMFSERDVDWVGNLRVIDLVNEIVPLQDASNYPAEIPAREAAKDLLRFMQEMEFVTKPQPEQVIKIVQDKSLGDMTVAEQLTFLNANPDHYSEVASALAQKAIISKAERKTPNWVLADGDKVDVPATVAYVEHLNKFGSMVRSKVAGKRPVTLARVFGKDERPMQNPFATKLSEVSVTGPFFLDFDLGNLDELRHLAYLWARRQKIQAWPAVLDLYEHVPAAFAETLTGRWQDIVDEYTHAKDAGDLSTEELSRYAPVVEETSRPVSTIRTRRDDAWYEAELRRRAGRGIIQSNESIKMGLRIVQSLRTTNSPINLEHTIVLDSIVTTNSRIKGCAYVPIGAVVSTTNASITPDIYEMTWEDLYNKAVQLGLISS